MPYRYFVIALDSIFESAAHRRKIVDGLMKCLVESMNSANPGSRPLEILRMGPPETQYHLRTASGNATRGPGSRSALLYTMNGCP